MSFGDFVPSKIKAEILADIIYFNRVFDGIVIFLVGKFHRVALFLPASGGNGVVMKAYRFCGELIGCEPYLAGNLGSGTIQEMPKMFLLIWDSLAFVLTEIFFIFLIVPFIRR